MILIAINDNFEVKNVIYEFMKHLITLSTSEIRKTVQKSWNPRDKNKSLEKKENVWATNNNVISIANHEVFKMTGQKSKC